MILRHDQIIINCNNIPTVIAVAFIFVIHVSILGQLVDLLYAAFLLPVLYYTGSKKAVFKTIVVISGILHYIVWENIRLIILHSLLLYCCCFCVRADCCTTSPEERMKWAGHHHILRFRYCLLLGFVALALVSYGIILLDTGVNFNG